MGFNIEYLTDGTVKATLNLKEEDVDFRCINLPEPPQTKVETRKPLKQKYLFPEGKKSNQKITRSSICLISSLFVKELFFFFLKKI